MLAVASLTLWAAFGILGAVLMVLVLRGPGPKVPFWMHLGSIAAAFFLSGVVTMLLSRHWLRPARGLTTMLKRVIVLASACYLLAFLAPMTMGSLFFQAGMTEWLSFRGFVVHCTLWLSWLAGGLAVSVIRARGRGRG